MRISDWSSDVCSSDLTSGPSRARSRATTRTGNFPTPTRREVKRASGGLALAALVAACSGGIVPQGAGPSSAGSSATPPRIDYNVPVRQPTPSTPIAPVAAATVAGARSEEHTSELQSLMRISYAVFCLKKKKHSTQRAYDVHKTQYTRPN